MAVCFVYGICDFYDPASHCSKSQTGQTPYKQGENNVSAESAFLGEISKLKRLVFIRFVFRTMLRALLILLCAISVALFVERAGLLKFSASPVLLIVSAGIFLAVAFLFAFDYFDKLYCDCD